MRVGSVMQRMRVVAGTLAAGRGRGKERDVEVVPLARSPSPNPTLFIDLGDENHVS